MGGTLTLEDFQAVEYPRDHLIISLVEYREDLQEIAVRFPSWHEPNNGDICHYFIQDRARDFCTCVNDDRYHKHSCWHLAWRPIVLKVFLNRKLGDDQGWLENIQIYGKHSVEQIMQYILDILYFQNEVSQVDLVDLQLIDYNGNFVDRRRIGVAFLNLYRTGQIKKSDQVYAQYAKRKGAKVWVWCK